MDNGKAPKILVITKDTMTRISGGSVMYRSIIEHIPPDQLCWVAAGGWKKDIPSWMANYPRCVITSPLFHRYFSGIARRSSFMKIWGWFIYRRFVKKAVKKISMFAQSQEVDKIWVHATDQLCRIALQLKDELSLPIHVDVQDDIDGLMMKEDEKEWIRDDFIKLLQDADTSNVICQSMKDYYVEKYGVCKDAVVFFGTILGEIPPLPVLKETITTIGYAGNMGWNHTEIKQLLDALEILNKNRDHSRKIILKVYGNEMSFSHPCLQYEGLIEMEKMGDILQTCDLVFLPMSFLEKYEILSQTSFPGKTRTYLKSQIPILAYGPEFASNVKFVEEEEIGTICTSNNSNDLAEAIESSEKNYGLRKKQRDNLRHLITTRYHPKKGWEELSKVLYNV